MERERMKKGSAEDGEEGRGREEFSNSCVAVEGELCVGGLIQARGYLTLPARTASSWVPNENGRSGTRMYRTGDLCRIHPDGAVQVIGRIDDQVKVRGFRIELGEIESTIKKHPAVADAAVVIQVINKYDFSLFSPAYSGLLLIRSPANSSSRQNTIFGYVVPVAHPASAEERYDRVGLRQYLKKFLPAYMVPSTIVELEKIPLNNNGKLNRHALPAPQETTIDRDQQVQSNFQAPSTPTEETLAQIWSEVLRVGVVGVYDNFFELGGDSIISIKVVSKSREKGLGVSIKQIFEYPTISELSKVVRSLNVDSGTQRQDKVSGVLANLPIQEWFFGLNLKEAHHFNQAEFMSVSSRVSSAHLKQAFDALFEHHDALRLICRREGGEGRYEQFIREDKGTTGYFTTVEVQTGEFENRAREVIREVQGSFSLVDGVFMKVVHFVHKDLEKNHLLIVIHHLAVDGVSWRILLEDLERCLQLLSENKVGFFFFSLPRGDSPCLSFQLPFFSSLTHFLDSCSSSKDCLGPRLVCCSKENFPNYRLDILRVANLEGNLVLPPTLRFPLLP
jgi:aryl carrier-like protein